MADREEFNIQADLTESMQEVQQYAALLNKAERHMRAISQKADESGGTITFKQAYKGTEINDRISQSSQSMQETLRKLVSDLNQVKPNGARENSAQYRDLQAAISSLSSVVTQNFQRSGILAAGQPAQTPLSGFIREKERSGSITGVPIGVRKGATFEDAQRLKSQNQAIVDNRHGIQVDVNRIVNQANSAQRMVDRSTETGNISYATRQKFDSRSQMFDASLQEQYANISENIVRYQSVVNTNKNDIQRTQKERDSGTLSAEEISKRTAHVSQLNAQNKVLLETISQLQQGRDQLDQAAKVQEKARTELNGGVENGSIRQQADPNSFLGQLSRYKAPIALASIQSTQKAFDTDVNAGNNLRSSMFDTYGNAYTAQGRSTQFDQVNRNLITTGTPYGLNATEMGQLAGSYSAYAGTRRLVPATRELANWARFGGLGTTTTTQVASAGTELGVIKSDRDVRDLSRAFTGSLESTGLLAQSQLQGRAYVSILSNLRGQRVTRSEAEDLGGILNGLGQQNPMLRGQNGANLINQFTNGSARSFNNPIVTSAFAAHNPKFAGTKGRARLLEFMQNPFSDISTLQEGLNTIRSYSGDSEVAAQQVSNAFGISMPNAKEMLKAARQGNLTQWAKDNKKTGAQREKTNQSQFENTGIAGALQQENYQNQGQNNASQLLDNVRGLTNRVKANPVANALSSGAGSLIQGLLSGVIAGGTQLAIGRAIGKTGLAESLKGLVRLPAKGLSAIKGLFTGGEAAAKGAEGASRFAGFASKGSEFATRGSELLSKGAAGLKGIISSGGSRIVSRGANLASEGLAKGSVLFSKGLNAESRVISKGATAGSKLLSAVEPIATRIGAKITPEAAGRVLGRISPVIDALAVTETGLGSIRDMSSRKTRKQNRGLGALAGMATGAAAGAAVGGVPGILFGAGLGTLTGIFPKVNEKIGAGVRGVWNGITAPFRPHKAKAATKVDAKGDKLKKSSSIEQKATRWIKTNKQIIDEYNKVVDKITFLHTGNDSAGDDTDIGKVSGKGEAAIRSMAKKIGKKLGIDPKYIFAQLMFESASGTSHEAVKDNNFGGITWSDSMSGQKGLSRGDARPAGEGGYYVHFDSVQDFANYYANMLNTNYSNLKGASSASDFAHRLKVDGYYTGSEASYASNIANIAKRYATGSVITQPTVAMYGERGAEARTSLSPTPENQANLKQIANFLGSDLLTNSQIGAPEPQGRTAQVAVKPKFNITLEHDSESVKRRIMDYVQQHMNQQSDPLLNKLDYYSNEIIRQ